MGKQYLKPGDLVRVRQELETRPVMVVEDIEKTPQPTGNREAVSGIRCFWFGADNTLHRDTFNFKDLEQC